MMKYLVYLSLILMLAGCVPTLERPSCSEIPNLRAQIGKEISPESFRQWVSQTYQMPLETITVERMPDGNYIVDWREVTRVWFIGGREEITLVGYRAALEQGVVDEIAVWGGSIPANQVIACLGAPERYRALYERIVEGTQLSLEMLFPAQGILAAGAQFPRSMPKQPPAINGNFPISEFRFVRPGSAEEVLRQVFHVDVYHAEAYKEVYEKVLRDYKPWPGNWQDIVVEITPNIYW